MNLFILGNFESVVINHICVYQSECLCKITNNLPLQQFDITKRARAFHVLDLNALGFYVGNKGFVK